MAALRRFVRRLLNALRPGRAEDDIARELASHLALLEDEFLRRGMRADEARRRARLALGGVEQAKELHRDARSFAWLDDARRDVSYAVRMIRRNPIVAATVVLSIAVAIGANTAVFTVANALLFRAPSGVVDADRLVDIGVSRPDGGFNPGSFPTYLEIRRRATTLDGVFARQMFPHAVGLGRAESPAAPARAFAEFVTTNYFSVLGVRSAVGRLFDVTDAAEPGASPVIVLSYRYWRGHFDGEVTVVGETIRLNGHPFTVIGVAPERFQGTGVLAADVWVPLNMIPTVNAQSASIFAGDGAWLVMGARLNPGVSIGAAEGEIEAIGQALAQDHPTGMKSRGLRLLPSSSVPGNRRAVAVFVTMLMGIVSLVLLVACANVSGILLARATARKREIAVRLSLGASRARLMRQLLTETTVLFLLGGVAGLLLARGLTMLLVSWLPALPFPVAVSLTPDIRVMAFTAALALIAALASGLAPALQTSRANPVVALKDDSQGPSGRSRIRHAFVVSQVALSVALVVAAGLFAHALVHSGALDPGFEPRGVELTTLDLSTAGHTDTPAPLFWRELGDRARALPGVQDATLARVVPGGFEGIGLGIGPPGVPDDEAFEPGGNIVEPGYFETLRIPMAAGRDFTSADRAGSQPVAIVGEAAAQHFWPGQNAIGRTLSQTVEGQPVTLLVVGVARDVRSTSLIDGMAPSFIYVPVAQQREAAWTTTMTLVIRSRHGKSVANDIRTIVASMNPNLPIAPFRTLEESMALGLVPQRVAASITGGLGVVGLLLAAVGIYGVTAFAVSRRMREFGIRIALGAQRRDVLRIVLRQGLGLTIAGCTIGLVLAAAAAQVLTSVLLGLSPLDPVTFAGTAVLFMAVGLAACYGPARRAMSFDPVIALRHE